MSESKKWPITIGVVAAMPLEIHPLIDRAENHRVQIANGLKFHQLQFGETRVVCVAGGAGAKRARQATRAMIDGVGPNWIISIGLSGALEERLRVGDLIVGTGIVNSDRSSTLAIDIQMEENPQQRQFVGKLCNAKQIVREIADKSELAEATGAIAVDMESFAVAQVAKEAQMRFLAVRAISDDLSEDLPKEVLSIFGPTGAVRAGALFGSILKRPSSVKDLWALRGKATGAADRLGKFLISMIPTLRDE